VYNAGNEIAVQAFLEGRIRFPEMAEVVSEAIERVGQSEVTGVADVLAVDASARTVATEVARRLGEARTT
jgi:1-deoxy-D-xylulose-5-phosphate reductoisomerase